MITPLRNTPTKCDGSDLMFAFFRRVSNSSRFQRCERRTLSPNFTKSHSVNIPRRSPTKRTPKEANMVGRIFQMLSRTCSVGVRMDSEREKTLSALMGDKKTSSFCHYFSLRTNPAEMASPSFTKKIRFLREMRAAYGSSRG